MAVRSTSSSTTASTASAGHPSLVPQGAHLGKPPIPLTRIFTLVGARNRAHLHLVSPSISKNHSAIICGDDGTVYVRDLSSRTHTIVNGRAIKEAVLSHADTLQIGTFNFKISHRASRRSRPAAVEPPKAALEVDGAEFPIIFEQQTILIGRRPTCDIPLVEESVSTIHAILFTAGAKRFIRDLGSRTGTFVNGSPIHQHELSFGDQIRVGDTTMRFEAHPSENSNLDELEHLVGTAALDEVPPLGHPLPEYDGIAEVSQAPSISAYEADTPEQPIAIAANDEPIEIATPEAPTEHYGERMATDGHHDRPPVVEEEKVPLIAEDAAPEPTSHEQAFLEPITEPPTATATPAAPEISDSAEIQEIEPSEDPVAYASPQIDEPRRFTPSAPSPVVSGGAADEEVDLDAGLDFTAEPAEETTAEVPASAEVSAPAEASTGAVDLVGVKEIAPELEPSLLDDDAADRVAAASTPPALRPEDTAFNFSQEDAEDVAPDALELDFAPRSEHIASPGGLDFSEGEPSTRSASAPTPGELPELDLSGLTLDPPAEGSDLGLDFAEDDLADLPAAPLLDLGAEIPTDAAPELSAFGNFDLNDAARGKSGKRPAARKEKPKKEKKTWWSRKRKSADDDVESVAQTEDVAPEEPLEAQIERALTGSFGSSRAKNRAIDPTEPFDSAEGLDAPADARTTAPDATTAHTAANDSFAGLDFSAVATGSGLDFGVEIDAVEPPAEAAAILPPIEPAEADGSDDLSDIIEPTEPTPESALDIDEKLDGEAFMPDAPAPITGVGAPLSQTSVEPGSLSDTAFGRAVSDFSGGASLDPIVETRTPPQPAPQTAAALVDEDNFLPPADAPASAASDADLSFEQLLDEELDADAAPSTADWSALEESTDALVPIAEGAIAPSKPTAPEAKVFDLPDWNPSAAPTAFVETRDSEVTPPTSSEPVAEEVASPSYPQDDIFEAGLEAAASGGGASDAVAQIAPLVLVDPVAPELAAEPDDLKSVAASSAAPSGDQLPPATSDTPPPVELPAYVPSDVVTPSIPEDPGHPMVSDLTSPTENEALEIAADPADAGHLGAAEAIDFTIDLETAPSLADATVEDLAPAEPVEETLAEAFDSAINREPVVAPADVPALEGVTAAPVDETISSLRTEADAFESGLVFDHELEPDELEELAGLEPSRENAAPAVESVSEPEPVVDAGPVAPAATPFENEIGGQLPHDPFFGLGRDTGSFLGGLPLALPKEANPEASALAPPVRAANAPAPARRPSTPAAFGSVPIGQARRPGAPVAPVATASIDDVEPIDFTEEAPAAPQSKYPTPPPPARSVPPRVQSPASPGGSMFDLGLGDVANGAVEIPPLAGGARPVAGQLTTAFDSLAFDALGQTDVFSQLSPTNDPVFGGVGRKSAAELDAEVDEALQGIDDVEENGDADDALLESEPADPYSGDPDAADDAPAAALPGHAESKLEKDRRPPGYTLPATDPSRPSPPAAQPPKKRRWGVRFLLPMMLLCGAGAAALVYVLQPFVAPRGGTVAGTLEFDRLKTLSPDERAVFESDQKKLATDANVLAAGAEQLRSRPASERMSVGFLGGNEIADVRARDVIATNLKAPENTGKLVLTLDHSADPKGDQLRMQCFLNAMYTRNMALRDSAGSNQHRFETVNAELNAATAKLQALKTRIRENQEKGGAVNERAFADDLAAQKEQLWNAWGQTSKAVRSIQTDLDIAAGADVGEVPSVAGVIDANAAAPSGDDPQLTQMTRQLQVFSKKLASDKEAKAAQTASATAAVNAALKKFQGAVDEAQKTVNGNDSALAGYLASAQEMRETFSEGHDALARQLSASLAMLNDLKKRLADRAETKLKDAWSNDSELKGLLETLSVSEHHRNAAAGSGLTTESQKLDLEISKLNARIQSRRDLLGTAFVYDAELKDEQDSINYNVARIESQRAANEQQMAESFAKLAKIAPSVEKLPAEQQKLAEALQARTAELNAAREQYAKAATTTTAAVSGSENSAIEQQLTQVQAKIDARKRELADAAAQSLTQKQRQDRLALIDRRKAELADAKTSEARAWGAYKTKAKEAGDAEVRVERAEVASSQLQDDIHAQEPLEDELTRLTNDAGLARQVLDKSIVPLPVRDDAVALSLEDDLRPVVASITFVLVVLLFSGVMWFVLHTPHDTIDSIPLAAAAFLQSQSGATGVIIEPQPLEMLPEYGPDPEPAAPRRSKAGRSRDTAQGDEHAIPA